GLLRQILRQRPVPHHAEDQGEDGLLIARQQLAKGGLPPLAGQAHYLAIVECGVIHRGPGSCSSEGEEALPGPLYGISTREVSSGSRPLSPGTLESSGGPNPPRRRRRIRSPPSLHSTPYSDTMATTAGARPEQGE